MKYLRTLLIAFFSLLLWTNIYSQCPLIIEYDDCGNRTYKGNDCEPDCSLLVVNTNDFGSGSLRKAIECATTGEHVSIDPSIVNETIVLTSGRVIIDKNIFINRSTSVLGSNFIKVQSGSMDLIFDVNEFNTVEIENMNLIVKSDYLQSPRILQNSGNLLLKNIILVDNITNEGMGATLLNEGSINIEGYLKLNYATLF